MKFMQQYPKVMEKEVGCNYNYSDQAIQSVSTGATPIVTNFSTRDIKIYWTKVLDTYSYNRHSSTTTNWKHTSFNDNITPGKQYLNIANNLPACLQTTSSSVVCTKLILNTVHVTGDVADLTVPKTLEYSLIGTNKTATFCITTTATKIKDITPDNITTKFTGCNNSEWTPEDIEHFNKGNYTVNGIDKTILNNALSTNLMGGTMKDLMDERIFIPYLVIDKSTVQQLVDASVFITENVFPGHPLNIEGLWDLAAGETSSTGSHVGHDVSCMNYDPAQGGIRGKKTPRFCCAYEWEVLPTMETPIKSMNNGLIPKTSTQEQTCWRINLRNIILPNVILQSGSLASFYPYFYVEFTNITDTQRQSNMIMSNNPNSKSALFRCSVTDIAQPQITKFLKLSGDGMYQTVRFRPNDSIQVRIYLPDGRQFMTSQPDNAPPSEVNPLLQITSLFEIEHIDS